MPKDDSKSKRSGRRSNPLSAENRAKIAKQVRDLAEPLCAAEGMELVHVEYQRESSGRILRVYIDRPGGIRLDDCVHISRQLNDILDVYLEHDLAYSLEVSSPGSDRPLGRKKDFDRFKGRQASVKTLEPMGGRKNFKGILLGLTEGNVNLRIDGGTVSIPLSRIQKARLLDYHGEN